VSRLSVRYSIVSKNYITGILDDILLAIGEYAVPGLIEILETKSDVVAECVAAFWADKRPTRRGAVIESPRGCRRNKRKTLPGVLSRRSEN